MSRKGTKPGGANQPSNAGAFADRERDALETLGKVPEAPVNGAPDTVKLSSQTWRPPPPKPGKPSPKGWNEPAETVKVQSQSWIDPNHEAEDAITDVRDVADMQSGTIESGAVTGEESPQVAGEIGSNDDVAVRIVSVPPSDVSHAVKLPGLPERSEATPGERPGVATPPVAKDATDRSPAAPMPKPPALQPVPPRETPRAPAPVARAAMPAAARTPTPPTPLPPTRTPTPPPGAHTPTPPPVAHTPTPPPVAHTPTPPPVARTPTPPPHTPTPAPGVLTTRMPAREPTPAPGSPAYPRDPTMILRVPPRRAKALIVTSMLATLLGLGAGYALWGYNKKDSAAPDTSQPAKEPLKDTVVVAPADADCQLKIDSTPSDARVTLSGKDLGETPVHAIVPCEKGELKVTKRRFETTTQPFTAVAAKPVALNLVLKRPTHKLMIKSVPPGAAIHLNGEEIGETPLRVSIPGYTKLPLVLKHDGFKDYSTNITAKKRSSSATYRLRRKR